MQRENAKENLEQSKNQLRYADQAYEKAMKVKQSFMREKDRKIKEAREALRASERAEWQARVADALESFETGGLDQTHTEMVNRLNERTARNEARMEIALESVDTETMEIEANAEKIRAQELVNQFKVEMGKADAGHTASSKSTIDIDEPTPEAPEGIRRSAKTGPKRDPEWIELRNNRSIPPWIVKAERKEKGLKKSTRSITEN